MTAWNRRANELFLQALEIHSSSDREGYLDSVCAGDLGLRAEVESLLDASSRVGSFLESPAAKDDPTECHPAGEGPGTQIGPYKIVEQIGEGGMGAVYLAQQIEPVKRLVALKVIKAGMDSRQVIARFEAERQALAWMDHPNIAKVLDGGTTSTGRPYFVMELVKGAPITRFSDERHLTPRERLELFLPVCHAIQHAHQKGIIHRDIKPTNVLVAYYDGKPVPKVIDFGVAKAAGQPLTERTLVTGFGGLVGTPQYMSPEQAELNQLDIDTRSDVYSLGILLYELLTGTTPLTRKRVKGTSLLEVLRVIREEEPQKPSTRLSTGDELPSIAARRGTEPARLSREFRGEIDWIVMKALEKDRRRRYETASGFAADVERYLAGETVQAVPASVGYRLRKFARRNKRALVSAALAGLALLILAGGLGWVLSDRAARQARTAYEVNQLLQRAQLLYAANKLPEAVAAAQKARGVLTTSSSGDGGIDRSVQQWVTDLETAVKLDEMLMEFTGSVARDRFCAKHARVFQDCGIDVEALSTEEAAARIANSHVKLDLVFALERWASVLRNDDRPTDRARWQRLLDISRAADPDPWRLRYNAAREASDLKALQELASGADLNRLRTRILASLGDSLRGAGDAKGSVAFLRKVQRQYPTDSYVNASLAWSYRSLDPPQWDDAIAFRRIAVAIRPESPMANFYLGYSLQKQGKLDEALAYFQTAVDLDEGHAPAQYSLAYVLSLQEKSAQALVHFQIAVDLRPTDPFPLNGLAWELATCSDLKLRDPARAVTLAKKVVELSVGQKDDRDKAGRERLGNYWSTLGVAHYRAGNIPEAVAALKTSLEFAKGYESRYVCEDWLFLAMANWKLGKKDDARQCYDRAGAWMTRNQPKESELLGFRTEATALLEVRASDAVAIAPPPRAKE